MKKVKVCVVLFIFLLVTVLGINQIFAEPCGDVNSDGAINVTDALVIAQFSVGKDPANFDVEAADVDGDGGVDIKDALFIVHYYIGYASRLPGCSEGDNDG